MKIIAEKVDRRYLHLTFESRRDRDKIYDYIKKHMMEKPVAPAKEGG